MASNKCIHDNKSDCSDCYDLAREYRPDVTFHQAISESYENARNKGFHEKNHSFGDRMLLAVSELLEAFDEYRNNRDVAEIYFVEDEQGNLKPEGVPVEIADCLIRLFDDCGYYGIPIIQAYSMKRDYNKTRPHLHGGKRL